MVASLLFAVSVLFSGVIVLHHSKSQQNAQTETPDRQVAQQEEQVIIIINQTEHAVTVAIDFSGVPLMETSSLEAHSRTRQPVHPRSDSGIMKLRIDFGVEKTLEKEVHFFKITGLRLAVVIESEESIQLIM